MGNSCQQKNKTERQRNVKRLKIALGLTFTYMIVEAVGGWMANSLVLIADSVHMLTDVAALSLALLAIWFASKPATAKKTYGYYRLEILAAFINGILLTVLSLIVIYNAYKRLYTSLEIDTTKLSLIAFLGLCTNLICAYLLHQGQKSDLNLHGAWLHIIGDLLGSVSALSAGILIFFTGWVWMDSVTSFLISLIIIYGAWNLIKESVNVLLEGTPSHINLKSIEETIKQTENVRQIHDLHVWTLTSGIHAMSVHVVHEKGISQIELLKKVRKRITDEFGIEHLTIQMEPLEDEMAVCHPNCFNSEKT
ncbi:MAG: cation transporter [Acidobacteria bacterium]|nr:MAG: cation transporter [Acidobacteriota bacterium]GIU82690.1 MAG: cadmium, cobalt and zinc/H(+)-K(+) antiporter [Pyrinomonadaceae bacterium]